MRRERDIQVGTCHHLVARVAKGESKGVCRYDRESLLWQSTVAVKSDPVGSEVDGFAEMFIYAMLRARSYTLSKEGKAYLKIVEELKINIEREALTRIDCSASEFAPLRKEISGNYHFGGSLFSNIFSSNWGPLTYNFYTVGNVSVTKGSSYSISGRKVDDVDCPCCCFELSFSVELDFTDKFDFVPDRSWLNWSCIRYNLLALPFSYVYNGVFGASCPEVTAHINEQWEKKLCGLGK